MLTIAIPTFNDYQSLEIQLERLSNQTKGLPVEIKIFDNNGFTNFNYGKYQFDNFSLFRQSKNIGGDLNIYSCFINCNTDYLWVLSTNDIIKEDCVENVLKLIDLNSELLYFNLGQKENLINDDIVIITEKLNYIDAFTISRCVYNLKMLRPFLKNYLGYIHTNQAQILIIIEYLSINNNSNIGLFNYDPIFYYKPAAWNKKLFISNSFKAVSHLKRMLILEKKALNNLLKQIKQMLKWQLFAARSYQRLSFFSYLILYIRIGFIGQNPIRFFKRNSIEFLKGLCVPLYFKRKWAKIYGFDHADFDLDDNLS
jgi:hypothetical protein